MILRFLLFSTVFAILALAEGLGNKCFAQTNESYNPVIKHVYTCDPSTIVDNGTFYLVTGVEKTDTPYNWPFRINSWHIFSSTDMKNFKDQGPILDASAFKWMTSKSDCWASQIVKKDGKYYWYVCDWGNIGVAVSDNILGPYRDAIGKPLISSKDPHFKGYIDPTVYIDEDGSSYIYWGGMGNLFGSKLKDNMIELDGERIQVTNLKNYEEAPWLFKKDGLYYMAYSTSNGYRKGPIRYATATSPLGPWQDRDDILGVAYNSFTNHGAIVEYKDKWYMVYHNGALPGGGDYNRSVCIDRLFFNEDGTIQFVEQTACGPEGENAYNNWGPHAYAGVDAACLLTTGVTLNSRIVDDGRMIEDMWWKWEVVEGPGEIKVDMNSVKNHKINFTKAGNYKIKLTVSDGYATNSDEVNVKVYDIPQNVVAESDSLPAEMSVKKKGTYAIHLYYNTGYNLKTELIVNDKSYPIVLERTQFGYDPSCAIYTYNVELKKGVNTIRLKTDSKGIVSKVQISKLD